MKIFVQGDRLATGMEKLAEEIAEIFKEKQIDAVLGAYGELINIFNKVGCNISCFGHRGGRGNVNIGVPFVDCMGKASDLGYTWHVIPAWGIRLGLIFDSVQACLFLPGSRGTVAHLIPAIVIAEKHKMRVAVVGWEDEQVKAIHALLPNLEKNVFRSFSSAEAAQAVNFLIT
jgi:hypothetical protein